MPKKPANTAALRKAKADNLKLFKKLGVSTKKPRLTGYVADPLTATGMQRDTAHIATSDTIPAHGPRRKPTPACDLPIAQTYNKGPLMVVTRSSELVGSKRRD